ncbi:MAG: methyltransferase [Bacteroidales bacterium]|nr:methyltransferase [Bacteroidales bacterium]
MFEMKQFALEDSSSTMKVGTDAVLLGCIAAKTLDTRKVQHILDVGTGCGIVALMMAQRYATSTVDAIDVDSASVQEASSNFAKSPWAIRLHAKLRPLQQHSTPTAYDLIVSNPPYFSNSLKNEDARRSLARHDDNLSTNELMEHTARLLSQEGVLSVIVPAEQAESLLQSGSAYGLYPFHQVFVYGKTGKVPRLCVVDLSRDRQSDYTVGHESIADANGAYTAWYRELTQPFLLWRKN